MAAAHGTKKKTQLPKKRKQTVIKKTQRKKLLPKLRKRQLKRGKPQLKRGKPQPKQGKPQPKRGNHPAPPKTVSNRTYDQLISKVLRQLNRDKVPISTKAKGKMISFIRKFYNNVSEQAKRNNKSKRTCAIGSKELQNTLKRVMRKDQALKMVRNIRKVSCRHRR